MDRFDPRLPPNRAPGSTVPAQSGQELHQRGCVQPREGPEGEEGATDGSKLRDSDVLPSAPCYPALPVQKELARSSLVRNP